MDPIMTPSKHITWVNYSDLSGDGEREIVTSLVSEIYYFKHMGVS